MLEASTIEGTNVVSLTVDGAISADEQKAAQDVIDRAVADHGSARLLLDYAGVDVGRVEPKAVWEDLKATRVLSDVERVGVVADSGLLDKLLGSISDATKLEVRSFDTRDDAVAWLTS
ncbi:STAS/SEC14 domain-containing protein [Nocardioides panacisoli]|uniref:STAS/SEC14 domain-containing protein n=1 Tax=Nocardioides panacisoli TaxID=627624 RepID=UPI001C625712|nr:STAS/SEC14 domain-containing protein [Nocardioides panacisoli]QYJ03346.1 STAS/SEC14 domain-containing protein [Nocardioides panacisoli]